MSDYRSFIITARGGKKKKGKSGDAAKRSRLLKLVMPYLSSDTGKALASAVEAKDLKAFKKTWESVTSKLIAKLEEEFKDGNNERRADAEGKSKAKSEGDKKLPVAGPKKEVQPTV